MNPNVIDLVTHDPKTGEYIAILVQDQPWSNSSEQIDQLLQKLNNYVHFIEDGQLHRMYPGAVGQPIRLQLDCSAPPTGEAASLVKQAQTLLLERGISFAVNIIVSA